MKAVSQQSKWISLFSIVRVTVTKYVRYFGSEYLCHTIAADLVKHSKEGQLKPDHNCLNQVSVDGPSVN